MKFEDLDLIAPILKALREKNYTDPTEIQKKAIPLVLKRNDVLGCAQTGTGKTAAFAIPIIQQIYQREKHQMGKKTKWKKNQREKKPKGKETKGKKNQRGKKSKGKKNQREKK